MGEVIQLYRDVLPWHGKLGRNMLRDSRSLRYPFQTQGLTLVTAYHKRNVGPFDQGDTGSCTGNALNGNMVTDPFWATLGDHPTYSPDERGARDLYSAATQIDPFPGAWPPDDTGSDGQSAAKALQKAGEVSGYTHPQDGPAARLALTQGPIACGMKWWGNMFTADADGRVRVDRSSGLAGGHELSMDGIDVENGRVWGTQSWGPGWGTTFQGIPGRFYFTFDDFDALIADGGDATVLAAKTAPAPTPTPVPPGPPNPEPSGATDVDLWSAGKNFTHERHVVPEYKNLAHVLASWADGKGFTL